MSEKKTKATPEVVPLHLVMYLSVNGKAGLKRRVIQYDLSKTTLTARESNDERDAPMGLKRIRISDLPKLGGMMSNCVAARTPEEADATLRKIIEGRRDRAQKELAELQMALELFPEKS